LMSAMPLTAARRRTSRDFRVGPVAVIPVDSNHEVLMGQANGALRDAMGCGRSKPFCVDRTVLPVDRLGAQLKTAAWYRLDMDSSVSPTHGKQELSV
jgi:hypothetical protein